MANLDLEEHLSRIQSLEMRGISKSFLEVKANQNINLTINAGEILGLLGENGAGKTTLMNILYGLYHPDEGEIIVNGDVVRLRSPKDSMRVGIGMIHQHFMLVEKHSVLENIALGYDDAPFFFPHRALRGRIQALSAQYGLEIDPDKPVWELSAGEQQRVEIIKALSRKADLLIMDEPTSVLTPQEADELFEILRKMTSEGHSVILISHKLEEIMAICNRVMVLRKGQVTGAASIEEVNKGRLAEMMIGRQIAAAYPKVDVNPEQAEAMADRCRAQGIDVIGELPLDTGVTQAMVDGRPVTEYRPGSEISKALRGVWKGVEARL